MKLELGLAARVARRDDEDDADDADDEVMTLGHHGDDDCDAGASYSIGCESRM